MSSGINVAKYSAYEIDKYAIAVTQHNFPEIEQNGDVFDADFTQYENIDFLIGGSPCTYWSIAQKNDRRETEASGLGWELFSQYVRALKEAKPKYFIYENNKSMAKAIYESISNTFGFEPILINSALVSAQNRNRYYWCGIRNDDGTYRKADIPQPEDRGILLRDVLDGVVNRDKSRAIISSIGRTTTREYFKKNQGQMTFEPVNTTKDGKSQTIKAQYQQTSIANICKYTSTYGASGVAEPVAVQEQVYGRKKQSDGTYDRRYEAKTDNKSAALTSVAARRMVAEPVTTRCKDKSSCLRATYYKIGNGRNLEENIIHGRGYEGVIEPVNENIEHDKLLTSHKIGEIGNGGQGNRIYSINGKSVTQQSNSGGIGSNTGLYAIPVKFENDKPIKAVSSADGKTYVVHTVENGMIEIKGKTYPIKLADGFYIIRKLTVSECKRLQTVPEWYDFSVISDSQAYKCLGNGWTVEVIAHLMKNMFH